MKLGTHILFNEHITIITVSIVDSMYIICIYKDETGHIGNFLVTNLIVVLQWGNKGGEGEPRGSGLG